MRLLTCLIFNIAYSSAASTVAFSDCSVPFDSSTSSVMPRTSRTVLPRKAAISSGRFKDHKATFRALGLKRIGHTVYQDDSPTVRGMVSKVSYALEVEEVDKKDEG